jgi:hypothetical protein
MRYKIEADDGDGSWVELVRGEGDLTDARARARELMARAHNREVVGWRISEFADASFSDRVTTHDVA